MTRDRLDIQQIPLFRGINREFLRRSEGAVAVRTFNKGEVICRQGEFGSSAFYVDAGSVNIYIEGSENFGHVRTKKEGGILNRMVSMLLPRDTIRLNRPQASAPATADDNPTR